MSNLTDRAQKLIDNLPPRPWTVTEMPTQPGDAVIATVRDASGYPVLSPHPESFSMLTGTRESLEYFAMAADIIADLLNVVPKGKNEPE